MTEVMTVSKQGINAKTATNPNDFIFHSAYNGFKIIATGISIFNVPAITIGTYSFAHGLSYTPLVYAFVKVDGVDYAVNSYEGPDVLTFPHLYFFHWAGADGTNVKFKLENDDGSGHNFNVRYYIFEVPF